MAASSQEFSLNDPMQANSQGYSVDPLGRNERAIDVANLEPPRNNHESLHSLLDPSTYVSSSSSSEDLTDDRRRHSITSSDSSIENDRSFASYRCNDDEPETQLNQQSSNKDDGKDMKIADLSSAVVKYNAKEDSSKTIHREHRSRSKLDLDDADIDTLPSTGCNEVYNINTNNSVQRRRSNESPLRQGHGEWTHDDREWAWQAGPQCAAKTEREKRNNPDRTDHRRNDRSEQRIKEPHCQSRSRPSTMERQDEEMRSRGERREDRWCRPFQSQSYADLLHEPSRGYSLLGGSHLQSQSASNLQHLNFSRTWSPGHRRHHQDSASVLAVDAELRRFDGCSNQSRNQIPSTYSSPSQAQPSDQRHQFDYDGQAPNGNRRPKPTPRKSLKNRSDQYRSAPREDSADFMNKGEDAGHGHQNTVGPSRREYSTPLTVTNYIQAVDDSDDGQMVMSDVHQPRTQPLTQLVFKTMSGSDDDVYV